MCVCEEIHAVVGEWRWEELPHVQMGWGLAFRLFSKARKGLRAPNVTLYADIIEHTGSSLTIWCCVISKPQGHGNQKLKKGAPVYRTMTAVRYGNTYRRIPDHQAPRDRSGRFLKVHDWTLFVDVQDDSIIERVKFDLGSTFEPAEFFCRSPVPVGNGWMRFATRQTSYGFVTASIQIRGTGGSVLNVGYDIEPRYNAFSCEFYENRHQSPLKPVRLPDEAKFGIELELTVPGTVGLDEIQRTLERSGESVWISSSYRSGREVSYAWKIVPDSSIACNITQRDCNTLEIVSPVLQGGHGLSRIHRILKELSSINVSTNKSTGFHVHVDVSRYSMSQLVKICQQFVKYEDAIDSFMSPWRRTNSSQSQQFFQSNRKAVREFTMDEPIRALGTCPLDVHSLSDHMNPNNERYFKLNLQNLVTGRQPTLEFRQHASTPNYEDVSAWVRFCTLFCSNAAKLRSPGKFSDDTYGEAEFNALFWYVIKDRALRDFYRKRRNEEQEDACCNECSRGGQCSTGSGGPVPYEVTGFSIDYKYS